MKKKIMTVILAATMLMVTLGGCSSKVECDFCGEMKKCVTKEVWGEEVKYCSDCKAEIDSMFE